MDKAKQIIFSILLLALPIFKLTNFGHNWYSRVPQNFLLYSGAILLFALCQRNKWRGIFLIYALGLSIYLSKLNFTINQLYGLTCFVIIYWLIEFVQKLNEKWLKVCILYSSYLVFYYWIYKTFGNRWVAGAYLAFTIPLILSCSDKLWLNIAASIIPIVGVVSTKSTMAILAMLIAIGIYLYLKEHYKVLGGFVVIVLILGFQLYTPQLIECPFRRNVWMKSIKHVGKQIIGTGVRSYRTYGFIEGKGYEKRYKAIVTTWTDHAHNEFIETYCEYGLIGIIIVLAYLIFLFWGTHAPPEYVAGGLAIFVHACGYYALRLSATGILIIIYLGMLEKHKEE